MKIRSVLLLVGAILCYAVAGSAEYRTVELESMVMDLPLPGTTLINVSTDIVYHRPIYQGETLSFWDEAVEISDEKETRLGVGCFVTTVGHFQNQNGEPVATATNVQFRFTPRSAE